jgi:hypothetical protein
VIEVPTTRPADGFPRDDSERRDAFLELRETYAEAQRLVPQEGSYEELQWILGTRRDATLNPPTLRTKTIELVALWLQDLASEMDRRLPGRGEIARDLRDATARFLAAFRRRPAIPAESSGSPAPGA